MATSKCACGSTSFEIKELTNLSVPYQGPARFKFNAIQCSSCGIVVGTHEGLHLGAMLLGVSEKLGIKV